MRFARILVTGFAVLLLFPVISAPIYASTPSHGCAPTTPPPVAGSPVTPPATPGIVVINEVLNNPHSTWNCAEPAGSFALTTDSWVELYNPQNQPFNLYAVRASLDDGLNTPTFHFPFGAAIAAHGYFVVFPDSYTGMLNGNNLRLTFSGTAIDQVSTPTLPSDNTYARIPDGSANWQITNNPTIDASNLPSTQITPTSTPVSTKTSGGSNSGSSGSGSTTRTPVTGKQPGWTKLQLPASNSAATPTSNSPLAASPAASPTASAWDMPRRIILTVLVVALALSLFWCWKAFSST